MKKGLFIAITIIVSLFTISAHITNKSYEQLQTELAVHLANQEMLLLRLDQYRSGNCDSCIQMIKEAADKGHVLSSLVYDAFIAGEYNEAKSELLKTNEYDPSYLLNLEVGSMSQYDQYLWAIIIEKRIANDYIKKSTLDHELIKIIERSKYRKEKITTNRFYAWLDVINIYLTGGDQISGLEKYYSIQS